MTVWWPALIALGAGLLAGVLAALRLAKGSQGHEDQQTTLADLEERAAHAIQMLRDLNEQQARMDPAAHASERERLEALAAKALRERDQKAAVRAPAPARAAATPVRTAGQWRGFMWGAATMALMLFLYGLVNQESAPRAEGGSMTGNAQSNGPSNGGNGAPHGFPPEVQALVDRIQSDPNDVEALHGLTRMMLRQGAFDQARVLLDRAKGIAPEHAATRTYEAVLQAAGGDAAGAITALDAITTRDPTFADAWFFKGMLGMQTGNKELTESSWKQYVAVAPPGPQRDRVAGFLEGKGLPVPPPAGGGAMPPGHPPTAMPPGHPPAGDLPPGHPTTDLDGLLAQAKMALRQQSFPRARELVAQIEQQSPGHPVGRVYAAVLEAAGGDTPGAIKAIDAVLAKEPSLADGWFFRGMLGMQSGQPEVARESWEKFVAVAPEGPQKERIKGFLAGKGLDMPGTAQ